MKLQIIPSDHFRIHTGRTAEQTQTILEYHIGKDVYEEKKLWGNRYEDSFKIYPKPCKFYRTTTVVSGKLEYEEGSALLDIRVRLEYFVQVWLCGWCLCLLLSLLGALSGDWKLAGSALGWFFIGWGAVNGCFYFELHTVKKQFGEMFDCPLESIKKKRRKKG